MTRTMLVALALTLVQATAFAQEMMSTNLIADVVDRTAGAVVNIQVAGETPAARFRLPVDIFGMPFGFGQPDMVPRHGEGSGFIIDEKGLVATNEHVIEGASRIRINLADKRQYEGVVLGSDPEHDVAVVQIKDSAFSGHIPASMVAKLGDSDRMRVGEWVIAIGSPYSLQKTVTKGIISAKGRDLEIQGRRYYNLLQTDAAINPGNSGGPLLNLHGEVVGVNTAINPNAQAIGFAIPINLVKKISSDLITKGHTQETWIGVWTEPMTPERARAFNLGEVAGIYVVKVERGSPAARAGIQPGDVITQVNGEKVDDFGALKEQVEATPAGQKASLHVVRGGQESTVEVTVEEHKVAAGRADASGEEESGQEPPAQQRLRQHALTGFGAHVRTLTAADRSKLEAPAQITGGVVVESVDDGSRAAWMGLQPDDLVFWVNQHTVADKPQFEKTLAGAFGNGGSVLMKIWRDHGLLLLSGSF